MVDVKIILGIPGRWRDQVDLHQALERHRQELVVTGTFILDPAANTAVLLDLRPHDPALERAFALAGKRSLGDGDLAEIGRHTLVAYLLGPGGTVEAARRMMRVAVVVLDAGGIAVKVETTGVAHSPSDWRDLATHPHPAALYHAYVTLIGSRGTYYSCGMHNLGLRDAIATGDLAADEAARLLEAFLLYTLVERPALETGHTFGVGPATPVYRLVAAPCTQYRPDDPFHNPLGMWQLSQA